MSLQHQEIKFLANSFLFHISWLLCTEELNGMVTSAPALGRFPTRTSDRARTMRGKHPGKLLVPFASLLTSDPLSLTACQIQ